MPHRNASAGSAVKPAEGARRSYSPANFRSRNHDSAHAEADDGHAPKIHHDLVTQAEPEFIDTQEDLQEMLQHLRAAGRFAYDSEFIGELTYIPKLCLIQVASSQRIGLIDPLANLDLGPFWDLLCDPSVEKIVHAGQQDIEPVFRNHNKRAANIFDTQICAGFAGMAYPTALSKLVFELVGAKLGKGLTFTHWDQRPLTSMQLRYAADDVRYLIAVHDVLDQRMQAAGHSDWAKLECESLCDPAQYGFNPQTHYLRVRGSNSLPRKQLAILQSLTVWRDNRAREHNVPSRTFLKDEILLDLARSPVKSLDKLARVRGLPRPVERDYGEEIVATTVTALTRPVTDLPELKDADPSPQQRFRADALYGAFLCLCAGQSIDPNLVASRQEIGDLYRAHLANESVDEHGVMLGWRHAAAGQAMVGLLQEKLEIRMDWNHSLKTTHEAKKF